MNRRAKLWLLTLTCLGVAATASTVLLYTPGPEVDPRTQGAEIGLGPTDASESSGVTLTGAGPPDQVPIVCAGSGVDDVTADLASHLRSILPDGWTALRHFVINPVQAQRIVRETPGRIDALVRFCLSATDSTPEDIGSYACALVNAYFSSATDDYVDMDPELDAARRRHLVEAILSGLEENARLPESHAVSALLWLPYLNFDGQTLDARSWETRILGVAEPLMRSGRLGAAKALARLDVAPRVVADSVLHVIDTTPGDVAAYAYVLRDPNVIRVLNQFGASASESAVARMESCRSVPSYAYVAMMLRIARQDPWDVIEGRLHDLAVQTSVPDSDFVYCLYVAATGYPSESVRAFPSLLRKRPLLSLSNMRMLLHDSVDWRSTAHVIELLERGSVYWDPESHRLRQ